MVDFLIECNLRANRPTIVNSMMVGTTAKYEQDIKTMAELADESETLLRICVLCALINHLFHVVIADRRKNQTDKKDLLNTMMYQKDPKTGETLSDENIRYNVRLYKSTCRNPLTHGHIQLLTFLIAGNSLLC